MRQTASSASDRALPADLPPTGITFIVADLSPEVHEYRFVNKRREARANGAKVGYGTRSRFLRGSRTAGDIFVVPCSALSTQMHQFQQTTSRVNQRLLLTPR